MLYILILSFGRPSLPNDVALIPCDGLHLSRACASRQVASTEREDGCARFPDGMVRTPQDTTVELKARHLQSFQEVTRLLLLEIIPTPSSVVR